MPFGKYKNHADCVRKNPDKKDPDAFCAWLKRKIEGQDPILMQFAPEAWYALYRLELMATDLLGLELMDREKAEAALAGKRVWKGEPDAVVLDDHRWLHMWEKTLSRGNKLFLEKKELVKLHDLIVDEFQNRGLDAGRNHKSPMKTEPLELGGNLEAMLKQRESFLLDEGFISLVGSSVSGKEGSDLDVLFHATRNEGYKHRFLEALPEELRESVELLWEPGGPHGPHIPVYELWAVPVKNPKPLEPRYHISPMAPIKPATPSYFIDDPRELLEDGYFVVEPKGLRMMVHRKESQVIAFDESLDEVDIPDNIVEAVLAIEDPKTLVLDGFLTKEGGKYRYYILDLIWYRESEHIFQTAVERRHFMNKLSVEDPLRIAPVFYFNGRRDTIDFLKEEDGPFFLIPGSTGYPVDGSSNWFMYQRSEKLKLAEAADAKIRSLVDSGRWEGLSADERFSLMTKRKQIEALYPFAQMKTTKKGYSEREVFGLESVEDLAEDLFKVPNKQANEVKVDGFRVQLHKGGDQGKIFTESGHEITEQLPSIVADIKRSAAKSYVIDGEATPYDEEFTNLGRVGAAPAFAKGAKGPVDDSRWAIHVFDVLLIDGEQLHNKPYEERRSRLHGLEFPVRDVPKSASDFKFHIWENKLNWATSAEQMVKFAGEAAKVSGSEGAMFKQADSKYRLSGSTPLWSKMKAAFEIDVLVVGVIKKGTTFNYIGAIGPSPGGVGSAEPAPLDSTSNDFVKWKGRVYAVLGKTFNTKKEASVGDIIRVSVKDIRKIGEHAYHWFHPQVLEIREDKTRPDPVQTAETISKTVKKKQRASAYLVAARYGIYSPLACCDAPWIALTTGIPRTDEERAIEHFFDGDRDKWNALTEKQKKKYIKKLPPRGQKLEWAYLKNVDDVYSKLKDLGITEIIGTATKRELLEKMMEHEIDFSLEQPLPLGEILFPPISLQETTLPDEVRLNTRELASFFKSIRSSSIPGMKLSCGAIVPLKKVMRLRENPYMVYPETPQRFTLQLHVRGLSVHGDFRMTISKSQAIGWTLNVGKSLIRVLLRKVNPALRAKAGITEGNLKNLSLGDLSKKLSSTKDGRTLRKALQKRTQTLSSKQIRALVEELWKDEVEGYLKDPNAKILAQKKAPMSPVWLDYEEEIPAGAVGATKELEGHLIIMDRGTIEFGAQKGSFHEYFLKGEKLGKRRMVVRRVPTRKTWDVKESFAWLTFFTKPEDLPYVISSRAVAKPWMPPKGVSALPEYVRSQIPRNRQYWRAKNAKAVRDGLVKEIKAKKVPIKLEAGLQFAVKRVWHKGPEVRRGLPVTRYWLIIHDGSKIHDAFDFGKDTDPLKEAGATARRRTDADLKELIPTTGELAPKHSASRVKKIKTEFDTSDYGRIRILEDFHNRLMLRFHGKTLEGSYVLVRSGETWTLQKTELPAEKKALLLSSRAVLSCGTNDLHVTEKDGILLIRGPAIKPGEVIPMDAEPSFFTKQGIKAFWPSMYRQPVVVLHGELKGDVVGFVHKRWYDENTGWGHVEAVIWHPMAMQLILNKTLGAFSIEVIPETVWDAEHQHSHVIGGVCQGLSVVPKGACPTCHPIDARMGTIADLDGKVYKFGMTIDQYLQHSYYDLTKSTQEISTETGIPRSTVENWMKRYGIPRRDYAEARALRKLKDGEVKELGGRVAITALGTGAFTDICKEGREESPQCKEYKAGGKSRRNYTATLFTIGDDNLLINAPKGIIGMVGDRKVKPNFVLLEHIHEDVIGGLHELRALKPIVFATKEVWAYLRKHYRALSGQKGKFDKIYNFKRYVIKPGETFKAGQFEVMGAAVKHAKPGDPDALGFKIKLGNRNVWHCSDVLSIPNHETLLKGVDIFIGDGASLRRGIRPGHASMEDQIKWAQEADIPKIFFTQIGHVGKTHEGLNDELKEMAPNAQALFDGAQIGLGGSNPLAVLPEHIVKGLISNEVKVLIRSKPYSEYAKQAILLGCDGLAHGLYVEGFPEKMSLMEAKKLKHGLSDKEWAVLEGPDVWVYHPRILKRFEPAKEVRADKIAGAYIHDAELIEGG